MRVGPSEDLRHGMTEALVTNAPLPGTYVLPEKPQQFALDIV